jgi:hypothetical protein
MPVKHLIRLGKDHYRFDIDGSTLVEGTQNQVFRVLSRYGFTDLDFAVSEMDRTGDNIADFGMRGSFIVTIGNNNTFNITH